MAHVYFSQRNAINPNPEGLPLADVIDLFRRVYEELELDGYFAESVGDFCVDAGFEAGYLRDVDLAILLAVRKKNLWPVHTYSRLYTEDDLFDIIEFLFQHVSKPIHGTLHNYNGCGMHWDTFNKYEGQVYFRQKINEILVHYEKRFELSINGEILHRAEMGFELLVEAEVPIKDHKVVDRVGAAVLRYRRHGSTVDDRRQAVRDLADVLEYLKPEIKKYLTASDEKDLFNIANNFGVRHHNDKQKTDYEARIWLSWMFYFYLSTIHVVLRKMTTES